jgi:predicted nucleic acid-binding Zn ribbon protein
MTSPKPFGHAMDQLLHALGLSKKLEQYRAVELWPKIVGERLAQVTTAERVTDGKLVVHVANAAWRNELTFLKQEILKKIAAETGNDSITDILFR